jgi:hypothetical protein
LSDNNLRIAQTAPELCRNPLIARYYAPFAGALVPASRDRRDDRVQAVLLECGGKPIAGAEAHRPVDERRRQFLGRHGSKITARSGDRPGGQSGL